MSAQLSHDVTAKRLPVPLSTADLERMDVVRRYPATRATLGIDATTASEAALVQALLRAGLRSVEVELQDAAYERLSRDDEQRALERSAARRRQSAGL